MTTGRKYVKELADVATCEHYMAKDSGDYIGILCGNCVCFKKDKCYCNDAYPQKKGKTFTEV